MADAVEIKVAKQSVMDTLDRMERDLPMKFGQDLRALSRYVMNRFIVQRLSGGSGLRRRTGTLARSFRTRITGKDLQALTLHFQSTARYAPVLELGKTIRPRKAKSLAIPVEFDDWHPALTPAGVYRLGAGSLRLALPAAFPDWNFWAGPSRKGNWFLFGSHPKYTREVTDPKTGKTVTRRRAMPFFHLKKSVRVPPQMQFYQTIKKHLRIFVKRMNASAKGVIRG